MKSVKITERIVKTILCLIIIVSCTNKTEEGKNHVNLINEGIEMSPSRGDSDFVNEREFSDIHYIGSYYPFSYNQQVAGNDEGAYWKHTYYDYGKSMLTSKLIFLDYASLKAQLFECDDLLVEDIYGLLCYKDKLIGICFNYIFIINTDGTDKIYVTLPNENKVMSGSIIAAGEYIYFLCTPELSSYSREGTLYKLSIKGELTDLLTFDTSVPAYATSYYISGFYKDGIIIVEHSIPQDAISSSDTMRMDTESIQTLIAVNVFSKNVTPEKYDYSVHGIEYSNIIIFDKYENTIYAYDTTSPWYGRSNYIVKINLTTEIQTKIYAKHNLESIYAVNDKYFLVCNGTTFLKEYVWKDEAVLQFSLVIKDEYLTGVPEYIDFSYSIFE